MAWRYATYVSPASLAFSAPPRSSSRSERDADRQRHGVDHDGEHEHEQAAKALAHVRYPALTPALTLHALDPWCERDVGCVDVLAAQERPFARVDMDHELFQSATQLVPGTDLLAMLLRHDALEVGRHNALPDKVNVHADDGTLTRLAR